MSSAWILGCLPRPGRLA